MLNRPSWPAASAVALLTLTLAAASACTAPPARHDTGASHTTAAPNAAPNAATRITPMTDISRCAGSSSEVEEAFAPPGYVYAEWIGCGGIGFARSAASRPHFGPALTLPRSRGLSSGPAIA